jgi:hypothetical protein
MAVIKVPCVEILLRTELSYKIINSDYRASTRIVSFLIHSINESICCDKMRR